MEKGTAVICPKVGVRMNDFRTENAEKIWNASLKTIRDCPDIALDTMVQVMHAKYADSGRIFDSEILHDLITLTYEASQAFGKAPVTSFKALVFAADQSLRVTKREEIANIRRQIAHTMDRIADRIEEQSFITETKEEIIGLKDAFREEARLLRAGRITPKGIKARRKLLAKPAPILN